MKGNISSWGQDSIAFSGPGNFTILYGKPTTIQELIHPELKTSIVGDQVFVALGEECEGMILMHNVMGQIVASLAVSKGGASVITMDISGLGKGVYWISTSGCGKKMIIIQ